MMLILLAALLIQPYDLAGLAGGDPRVAQDKPATSDRELQRIAMEGWTAARALAPKGGAVEFLGPVNLRLKALDALPDTSARYAEIAIRAAVSAAQEERDELTLLLAHARDLSNQMELVGSPAQWPLPIDELEGELWLEVDRFTEARDAYERATKSRPSPNAWIGLARVSDRLGDVVTACRAYTTAASTKNLPSSVELEISLYALKCKI
jgi:tetratricopeptide (TPR) repeat protein